MANNYIRNNKNNEEEIVEAEQPKINSKRKVSEAENENDFNNENESKRIKTDLKRPYT